MPYLLSRLDQDLAEERMAHLIAAEIPAKIRYQPSANSPKDSRYAIFVDEHYLEKARQILGLDQVESGSDDDIGFDPDHEDSIFRCPRCGMRKIQHLGEPIGTILFIFLISLPLMMLPAIGWMIWKSQRGSRKRCEVCTHSWRSKP